MKVGPVTFWKKRSSPSGSVACKVWSAVSPSVTVMSAIASSTGARLTLITKRSKDLLSLSVAK